MNLPPLPTSWSSLSWQQLCCVWSVKQHYGGNADVVRVAVLLSLLELSLSEKRSVNESTGETCYTFLDKHKGMLTATARDLSGIAKRSLPWVDYPYGDPGEKEEKDEKGNIIKERREAKIGYVSPLRDAMSLPVDTAKIYGRHFALPQVACANLTWQQYRSLQGIAPQLFADGIGEDDIITLQSKFMAHILTPRTIAILDTNGGSIRFRPHYEYRYDMEQADGMACWFEKKLKKEAGIPVSMTVGKQHVRVSTLFHIVFQVYQTALSYYSQAYPLLFQDSGKKDPMRDALQGEVGTINTIMKYAGYAEQQQVYDSNLPFVLDILNTMTKEAKEMEKLNSKMKKK